MGERWPDDRLDDRFQSIERRFEQAEQKLTELNGMASVIATMNETVRQLAARMDHFREDTRDDFAAVHGDLKTVSRATIGLLTALLVAMVGAIIVLVVAL